MKNEFDYLMKVILAKPRYMEIKEIINEVQKENIDSNIDIKKALEQHEFFSSALEQSGVSVLYLDTDPSLNEQVFTRDIGFVIDDLFCVSNMKENIRKNEKKSLISFLNKHDINYYEFNNEIEGGDVVLHREFIFVGISNRTNEKAVLELKRLFPEKEIIAIKLKPGILHLDCVLNIISDEYALLYKEGIDERDFFKIKDLFNYVPITKEEQEKMGTNVLVLSPKKVISLISQRRISLELGKRGFDVIELDFSEIIKSGGSFRCCSLPLERSGGIRNVGKQKSENSTT